MDAKDFFECRTRKGFFVETRFFSRWVPQERVQQRTAAHAPAPSDSGMERRSGVGFGATSATTDCKACASASAADYGRGSRGGIGPI